MQCGVHDFRIGALRTNHDKVKGTGIRCFTFGNHCVLQHVAAIYDGLVVFLTASVVPVAACQALEKRMFSV